MSIFINGIGMVGAFGSGIEDFQKASEKTPCPRKTGIKLKGREEEILYFPADTSLLEKWIPRSKSRRYDNFTKLGFLAAFQALEKAGLAGNVSLENSGIIIATGFGPLKTNFGFIDSYLDYGDEAPSPTLFSASVYNSAAGALSIHLKTRGPNFTITQFDMSAPQALLTAMVFLNEDRCERIIVGGIDEFHPVIGYAFRKMYGLNSGTVFSPMDIETDTAVPSEGACFFMLSKNRENSLGSVESVVMDNILIHPLKLARNEAFVAGMNGIKDSSCYYRGLYEKREYCNYAGRYGTIPVSPFFDMAGALLNLTDQTVQVLNFNSRGDYGLVRIRVGG